MPERERQAADKANDKVAGKAARATDSVATDDTMPAVAVSGVDGGVSGVDAGVSGVDAGVSGVDAGVSGVDAGARPRILSVGPGTRLGRYQIHQELGAGGMATVFLARDTELRREVAVKVLFAHLCKNHEVVARFQREARAAAALDHEHILRVFDVGGGDECAPPEAAASPTGPAGPASQRWIEPPYIVMELVRGVSLQEFTRDRLSERERAPLAEVVACVGVVMCAALERAHRAGIVHRDVKPGNIMVAHDGRLALTDFGVARIEEDDSSLVTRAGALLGTPAFMSPEQALGEPLDTRSDIYSLGATLYHLATGTAPFSGPTARVVSLVSRGQLEPAIKRNPTLGSELSRIIDRMMAREPEARYQDCAGARAALIELVRHADLDDPDRELREFFADPEVYRAARTPVITRACLGRAQEAVRGLAIPRALALCDRVLALMPESDEARAAMDLVERIGRGRRVRHVLAGVGALVLVVGVWLGASWFITNGNSAGSTPNDAGANPGTDQWFANLNLPGLTTDASPMTMMIRDSGVPMSDGQADVRVVRADAGVSQPDGQHDNRHPDNPAGKPDGSHRRDPRTRIETPATAVDARVAGRPQDAAPITAVRVDAAPVPAPATRLVVDVGPWCDVYIDDVPHGRARVDRPIDITPGDHDVVCTQGPGRAAFRRRVTVRPGETHTVHGSVLTPVRITVAITAGERVRINNRMYNDSDTLELVPGRYRVDVFRGDNNQGGAWVAVPAVAACELRDRPALDCYR